MNDTTLLAQIGALLKTVRTNQIAHAEKLKQQEDINARTAQLNLEMAHSIAALNQLQNAVIAHVGNTVGPIVRKELQGSLVTMGPGIQETVHMALQPALQPLIGETGRLVVEAQKTGHYIGVQGHRFSNRVIAIAATSVVGALVIAWLAILGSLAWQRSEIAGLLSEKADLTTQIAQMEAVGQKLADKGLAITFGTCKIKGRDRKCVEAQTGLPMFGTKDAPFYVLKGY